MPSIASMFSSAAETDVSNHSNPDSNEDSYDFCEKLMELQLKHNVSNKMIDDLCRLIASNPVPMDFPKSYNALKRSVFDATDARILIHYYCSHCSSTISIYLYFY